MPQNVLQMQLTMCRRSEKVNLENVSENKTWKTYFRLFIHFPPVVNFVILLETVEIFSVLSPPQVVETVEVLTELSVVLARAAGRLNHDS